MAEWPKEVRRLVTALREDGFSPVVTGEPGRSWEVAVEGERIRVTAAFTFSGGRTRRRPGTCTVDGEPHALVPQRELRDFWDEHEGTPAEVPAPVLTEISDPGGRVVPAQVKFAVDRLASAAGDRAEVRVGVSGSHWVAGIDLPGGDGLRMLFTRSRHMWDLDRGRPLQVIAGGEDKSAEAAGDVEKAMALLVKGSVPPAGESPPGAGPVRRAAPARRDLGVETRNMVVIRE